MILRLLAALLIGGLLSSAQVASAVEAAAEPGPHPVVAFIGDSYAEGAGASDPGKRWPTLVSQQMGWTEANVALGGTGYLKSFEGRPDYFAHLDHVATLNPYAVVVSGGQNDQGLLDSNAQGLFAGVSHFYVQLRARLPQARIIGVGPSFPGPLTPGQYAFDQVVREAVLAVDGQYISLIRPVPVLTPSMVLPDGVHVGDAGHAVIAHRVLMDLYPV